MASLESCLDDLANELKPDRPVTRAQLDLMWLHISGDEHASALVEESGRFVERSTSTGTDFHKARRRFDELTKKNGVFDIEGTLDAKSHPVQRLRIAHRRALKCDDKGNTVSLPIVWSWHLNEDRGNRRSFGLASLVDASIDRVNYEHPIANEARSALLAWRAIIDDIVADARRMHADACRVILLRDLESVMLKPTGREVIGAVDWLIMGGGVEANDAVQYVTLDQMAALCNRSKRTLEKWLRDRELPDPDVQGGGGKPNEWNWANVRETLEKKAERVMPQHFPKLRQVSAS